MFTRQLPVGRPTCYAAVLALLLIGADATQAQDLHPSRRPSPMGLARTHLGDTYVKVHYSRPYVRNREIFGENTDEKTFLVPFGEVWRTGANEATEITFTGDLMIDGTRVEAGTYSIFSVPGEESWNIHVSPQLGLSGTARFNPESGEFEPAYDPAMDVLVVEVPAHAMEESTEQMTFSFEPSDGGAHLVLRWEYTEIRIPLELAS